ncbi:alpha-tocopherol transfer protein-like [Anopheles albimanus]|uniref:alpha-tocopherol transfer protein-like n=1 Tax=Anopheles albimanus TaxID=7167 RepID=UPI0016406A15|nr:alpha-tocopherol transfer protein-like [Anopheles albimanus]
MHKTSTDTGEDQPAEVQFWPQVDVKCLKEIKQWLIGQPHLPALEDHDIALFLHANYNNQQATQTTIENYCSSRTNYRDFFADRDIFSDSLQTALSIMMFAMLPGETKEGYKMVYSRLRTTDTTHFNHPQILKTMAMCMDLWVKLEGNANGHILLSDMQGMHKGHLTKFSMGAVKKQSFYFQEALPIRLKQIHFINVNPLMNRIMFLVRPFMRKDVQEMINMHVTNDTLYSVIPQESLPNEYGGKAGTFEEMDKSFKAKLYAHRDWFKETEDKYLVDESKRAHKPKGFMFGLFG